MWAIANKTCVITGATAGIGQATALALAERGARVVIVCRNPEKGAAVVAELAKRAPAVTPAMVVADLSSQAEVRRAAAEVLALCPRIDVLLNNAGAVFDRRETTVDGLERTFGLNHMSYFLLTQLLLDRVLASAPARIINVASNAHHRGRMRFEDLQRERDFTSMGAYAQSKLANILFTRELSRRVAGRGVTVNCLHPGVIASSFAQGVGGPLGLFFKIARPFLMNSEDGAKTSVTLAVAPELESVTGEYFEKSRVARMSPHAASDEDARRLWESSERLVQAALRS